MPCVQEKFVSQRMTTTKSPRGQAPLAPHAPSAHPDSNTRVPSTDAHLAVENERRRPSAVSARDYNNRRTREPLRTRALELPGQIVAKAINMPADILLSARQLLTGRAKKPTPSSASKDIIPLEDWENPPRDNKPIARWWWPGGSVDKETCERHLRFLKETGFGSVEVCDPLHAAPVGSLTRVLSTGGFTALKETAP